VAKKKTVSVIGSTKTESCREKLNYTFMERHPQLSLGQSETTALAGVGCFSGPGVSEFFDVMEQLVQGNELDASRDFSADETCRREMERYRAERQESGR
jgi:hypothetical protein